MWCLANLLFQFFFGYFILSIHLNAYLPHNPLNSITYDFKDQEKLLRKEFLWAQNPLARIELFFKYLPVFEQLESKYILDLAQNEILHLGSRTSPKIQLWLSILTSITENKLATLVYDLGHNFPLLLDLDANNQMSVTNELLREVTTIVSKNVVKLNLTKNLYSERSNFLSIDVKSSLETMEEEIAAVQKKEQYKCVIILYNKLHQVSKRNDITTENKALLSTLLNQQHPILGLTPRNLYNDELLKICMSKCINDIILSLKEVPLYASPVSFKQFLKFIEQLKNSGLLNKYLDKETIADFGEFFHVSNVLHAQIMSKGLDVHYLKDNFFAFENTANKSQKFKINAEYDMRTYKVI